jgi:5-formyltetrahydrofolate cyclo-ligase
VTNGKSVLRKEILGRRMAMETHAAMASSRAISERLVAEREFGNSRVVAMYHGFRNEVDTREIFKAAMEAGKDVFFPRVTDRRRGLIEFLRVDDLGALVPGEFGIMEPPESGEAVEPGGIDLFLVPGVAFDAAGNRLGYGAGYYDRALSGRAGRSTAAGLAYEFQVVGEIPSSPDDERMNMVVTEKRTLRFKV